MVQVLANTRTTVLLQVGEVLRVTGDGVGAVTRLAYPNGSGDPYPPTQYDGKQQSFGPFDVVSQFRIYLRQGSVDYSIVSEEASGVGNGLVSIVAALGFVIATPAALAATTVPSDVDLINVTGYSKAGDLPVPMRLRKVAAAETIFNDNRVVFRSNGGAVQWTFKNDVEMIPQWFGGIGNTNGKTGNGNDDAPAIRAMQEAAELLGIRWSIPEGNWRLASWVVSPSTQRVCTMWGDKSRGRWSGRLIHDCFTNNEGSPAGVYTKGTASNYVTGLNIIIDGGELAYPDDALPVPGADSRKSGITVRFARDSTFFMPRTTGKSYTGFQVTGRACEDCLFMAGHGTVGAFPEEKGTDWAHFLEGCKNVTVVGFRGKAGDDCISITEERGARGSKTRGLYIYNCAGSTQGGRLLKVHIIKPDSATVPGLGAIDSEITDVHVGFLSGRVTGTETGGGIAILNDGPEFGNIISRIYTTGAHLDAGTLPKNQPNAGTGGGVGIFAINATHVWFTDCHLRGSSNALLGLRNVQHCHYVGGSLTTTDLLPVITSDLTVTQTSTGTAGLTRYQFSGSPDLQPIVDQLALFAAGAESFHFKLPILRVVSGMANAYNIGRFVIRGVDNTNKWVDVENFRPGGSAAVESGASGIATIELSKVPDIQLIDIQNCSVTTKLYGPKGWAAIWALTRGGTLNANNKVDVEIYNQDFGNALRVDRSIRGSYKVKSYDARSGSYGVSTATNAAIPQSHDEFEFEDVAGAFDGTQGYGRTALLTYTSTRIKGLRGVTPSMLTGQRTIAAGATTLPTGNKIYVDPSRFSGLLPANMDERWITVQSNTNAGNFWVTYDSSGTPGFDINLSAAAPAGGAKFSYVIKQPGT